METVLINMQGVEKNKRPDCCNVFDQGVPMHTQSIGCTRQIHVIIYQSFYHGHFIAKDFDLISKKMV